MKKPKAVKDRDKSLPESLQQALDGLNKEYGEGSVDTYGNMDSIKVAASSSGSLGLDMALGVGGYPKGRIIEVYGLESSGKTTLALHAIAQVQKNGGKAVFIDAEHALDPQNAMDIGVDIDSLILSQPSNGEEALNIAERLCASGAVDMVVIDSVAALVPRAEIEGDMGDSHMGLQARLMSQALRKLAGVVHNTGTILILINQIRMKIGVMFGCFQYDTRVTLADGSSEKIGKIVNQQLPVEVMSFDPKTGKCVSAKVIGWHANGKAESFLQFVVEGVGGSGRATFGVTPNHHMFVPSSTGGWTEVEAGSIKPGDTLGAVDLSSSVLVPVEVKDIYTKPKTRSMRKFDLTVEGHHTYLVDGVAVHNSPETTSGGNALKFFATQRIEVRRVGVLKEGEKPYGIRTRCKVVKNKVSAPFREAELSIIFGSGIDNQEEVIDAAVKFGLIEKSGSWYKYNGASIGQGTNGAKEYFSQRPDDFTILTKLVRTAAGLPE